MDAETHAVELNLPQAFLLLATNDKDGKPEVPMYALRTTLAGAILAELEQLGAIELRGKHVKAAGTAPKTGFQRELEFIRHKSRPHTPKRWVSNLESRAEVQRVYEGMASLGIVEHAGEKHLGLFRTVRYPEKDHGPEAAVLTKIEAAIRGSATGAPVPDAPATNGGASRAGAAAGATEAGTTDAEALDTGTPKPSKPAPEAPEDRTLALIALLQAAGLLTKLFPGVDRLWAYELAKDYWPARAVEDELRMIRLAEEEAPAL
ncbi:GPP34 family phosphoprotein [Arthrobacter sp. CDRTa11]|uniref:GOLPH3/VPS74 family protein n=1 Tax=Arthrobacter sp. CDRTa11 TaxID=2651199 RepID=UPI002265F281|nr:GPP34 family phosphoprotein [Arthrobacter sp. CDRTa11]UZX04681.1 GPP34 family phosphoprotein [Arthrobacter sp. CDRTa11]